MNKIVMLTGFYLLALNISAQTSTNKDTIYIQFEDVYKEMRKDNFTEALQAGSPEEKLKKSIVFYIEQMEPPEGNDFEFSFSHFNQSQRAYNTFGGKPPVILYKPKSYLKDKKVLDINFFRKMPYIQVAKTFEKEDSWEQDVVIFIVDVDEIKNDSIVLREVKFTRPVKE